LPADPAAWLFGCVDTRTEIRFAIAFCMTVTLVAEGTIGYALIEVWSLNDSLYMTVITITTVGYGEAQQLSESVRVFTIVLLLCSIATAGYSASTVISFIFEGQIFQLMRDRRMNRSIANLSDHYII